MSVQLGIGGWKPYSAAEVHRLKYGDCKGLTNYTSALLEAVGVDSHYSIVYAGRNKKDLPQEFASIAGNHAFLTVPIGDDKIWLECTSQDAPVNYLGRFTDDRYVLEVSKKGGELIKTKKYEDEENKTITRAIIDLQLNGDMSANVQMTST